MEVTNSTQDRPDLPPPPTRDQVTALLSTILGDNRFQGIIPEDALTHLRAAYTVLVPPEEEQPVQVDTPQLRN